jgi:nucleoside-diphosphate-sugar epimerase
MRGEAYCYGKINQEQLITKYGETHGVPYVVVRPGSVYGADKKEITGRVGISRFGFFLHMGGSNTIPLTYVDNCADAIISAGLIRGIDREVFNVVDDDLPSSRVFLRLYKQHIANFRSVYVPHVISYLLCWLWEKCSQFSSGRLPLIFNRRRWHAEWKKTEYTNAKLKAMLGWTQTVSTAEGLRRYFQGCGRVSRKA